MKTRQVVTSVVVLGLLVGLVSVALAQGTAPERAPVGTAFTYQGRLADGSGPVTRTCDFTFRLYDSAGGGSPPAGGTLVGTDAVAGVAVVEGHFTAELDFGAGAFPGEACWLEIEVNCGAGSVILSPRQALTPTPYALWAAEAGRAPWSGLTGVPAGLADGVDADALAGLACDPGEMAVWDGADWVCGGAEASTHSCGTGLRLSGGQFSLAGTYRLPQACADGQVAQWDETAKVWVCAADDDALGALACADGEAAQWDGAAGAWVCAADNATGHSAGNQLSLVGTTFHVLEGAGSGLDADLLDGQDGAFYRGWANLTGVPIGFGDGVDHVDDADADPTNELEMPSDCGPGQIVEWDATGGDWTCAEDDDSDTTYTAGNQLSLLGTTFHVLEGAGSGLDADLLDGQQGVDYQARVDGACPAGQSIRVINANGTVVCETDDSTADHGALSGLGDDDHPQYFSLGQNEAVSGRPSFNGGTSGTSAPFSVDSTYRVGNLNADLLDGKQGVDYQARVDGACPAGQSIRVVNADGTVTCDADDSTADHGALLGLADDDHTQYFNLGQNEAVSGQPSFNGGTSGTSAPFSVDSTYLVTKLNADLLDGKEGADYHDWANLTGMPAGFADGVDNLNDADADATNELEMPAGCAPGQMAIWDDTAVKWKCADTGGGDVTAVNAGLGLSGGGASGAVTLNVQLAGSGSASTVARSDHQHDTRYYTQVELGGDGTAQVHWSNLNDMPSGFADREDDDTLGGLACGSGEVAKWNGGAWACQPDEGGTAYTAGKGLELSDTKFRLEASYRLPQGCEVGEIAVWSGSAWICQQQGGSETPVVETSTPETPVVETSTPETPVVGTSTPETPVVGTSTPETPVVGTSTPENTPSPGTTPPTPGTTPTPETTPTPTPTPWLLSNAVDNPRGSAWADSDDYDFGTPGDHNSFWVRATDGIGFVTTLTANGDPGYVCILSPGSSWSCSSDRQLKEDLIPVDGGEVLAQLGQVPIYAYSAKGGDPSIRHMGPMAQDFYAAFGLGEDDRHLATIDLDGVALAAIQGLHAENEMLRAEVAELEGRLAALEALVSELAQEAAGDGP